MGGEKMISQSWVLGLSLILFTLGVIGIMIRKNLIILLLSLELMLNAVNLNFVLFSHHWGNILGQVFSIFVMAIAAGEAAIGLGIIIAVFRLKKTMEADLIKTMEG